MRICLFILSFLCFVNIAFAQDSKKVLLIGIDGCRADALEAAATPHIDALRADGIYSPHALNDDITISGPGWSAILCGVTSDKHLVTGNDFSGNNYAEYPSLFGLAEELHGVSICHWGPINDWIVGEDADFKLNVTSDAAVAEQAASYLSVNDPDIVFLHFDDIDVVGHGSGFSPEVPEYLATIEATDTHIGTVLTALTARPNYEQEDWLIILTSDHGGLGFSHGGNSFVERNVSFIVSGKNVPTDIVLRDSTVTENETANCLGENISELTFDGENDYVHIPSDEIFNFGAEQDFTVECRVRTTNAADVAIVGNKNWNTGVNKGFVFSFRFASGPEWKVNIGDGENRTDIDTGGEIADGEWHTLSVTFDRDGMMRMYEDGTFVTEADISNIGDIDTDAGLYFGTDINQAYDFTGSIAEVRIWNKILEASTIETYACQSVDTAHPAVADLLGYWKLDEGEGSSDVADSSPYDNPGVINAAAWAADTVVIYNYDDTPRLTDAVATALTHLCIPLDPAWELEGNSLIPECIINQTEIIAATAKKMRISPNPLQSAAEIILEDTEAVFPLNLNIYSNDGKLISVRKITAPRTLIDMSDLTGGVYFFSTEGYEAERVVVQR